MEKILFISIGVVIGVILTIIFLPKSKIIKTEEVDRNTYDVTLKNNITGNEIPSGKETKIVQKITYDNGKVKYKTITYSH